MNLDFGTRLTRESIARLPVLATDGAWGTELMKLEGADGGGGAPGGGGPGDVAPGDGAPGDVAPGGCGPGGDACAVKDLWNLTAPEKVLRVARSYVDAGSSIILTNTFSANRVVLATHGVTESTAAISRAGAEISKKAAAGRAWVFASIGPTGKMVSLGELDAEEAEAVFAEEARALAEGGADAIVVETQTDLDEARAALRGCLRACELPVGVTFTFDSGKDSTRTMMGVTVAAAWQLALEEGASFVGANCGVGLDAAIPVARIFAGCGEELPIWIKGNAGKPELGPDGKVHYRASPEDFAAAVGPLLDAGVRFVGGCCGSTPAHIRALCGAVRGAAPSSGNP